MTVEPVSRPHWFQPERAFQLFKTAVYLLLSVNVFLFFQEESLAAPVLFPGGVNAGNALEAYSATIDTLAWVILLWLFELETAVISDERLRGGLKWVLMGVRSLCYLVIFSAFWGYLGAWLQVTAIESFALDPCSLLGTGGSTIDTLDEYPPLDTASCAALQGESLMRISGTNIIGTLAQAAAIGRLAFVDVINSGAWLLVVFFLEIEVLLQVQDRLGRQLTRAFTGVKGVLYATLLAAAIYWGFAGDFLDFWDAFLWLVAFVFIELNIFQWQAEVAEEKALERGAGTA